MELNDFLEKRNNMINACIEVVNKCKEELRELTVEEKEQLEKDKEEIKALNAEIAYLENKSKEEEEQEVEQKTEEMIEEIKEEVKEEIKEEETKSCEPTDDEKEIKNKRSINTKQKMEQRFSIVKELRNALETGKKIDFADINKRAYSVTDEGEDVVVTDVWNPLEALYTKNQLVAAGARTISGIKNNQQVPIMGKCSVGFAAELSAATDGSGSITSKTLSPKRLTAYYPVSLQLLAQDSIGVENAIRKEIEKALADKLEATVLGSASGDTTKPAGMFYNVTATTVTNFSGITALEEGVEAVGVDIDACKYIVSPSAKASLRNLAKSAKSTELVMQNGEIDGTEALCTAHVPSGKFVYGDFSNVVLASWDNVNIEVVRDSAGLINGKVMIIVNAFVDAVVLRDDAFAFGEIA